MQHSLSTNENQTPAASRLLDEKLFKARALTIFGDINERMARNITERLLALSAERAPAGLVSGKQ